MIGAVVSFTLSLLLQLIVKAIKGDGFKSENSYCLFSCLISVIGTFVALPFYMNIICKTVFKKLHIMFPIQFKNIRILISLFILITANTVLNSGSIYAQSIHSEKSVQKRISTDLFGVFFEDINYAADGGLYAELVQNRSFEYSPADHTGWNPFTAWEYITPGYAYGNISVASNQPVHENNPHYVVLTIEEPAKEGVGLKNSGFNGIPLISGDTYLFSIYIRQLAGSAIPVTIQLTGRDGKVNAETKIVTDSDQWKKYTAVLKAGATDDSASLVIIAKAKGVIALDEVSLFPQKTYKNEPNGLRNDIAGTIAAIKPRFIRFPGGCLVHGDGLGNMYRWKNTIGPVEQRIQQKNIWGYHQSVGLGFFEYFRFCEDIGAEPLPVLPAAVCCQNSGGSWGIGGTGQHGLTMQEMGDYIQDVLDLIEYANGPANSVWGAKRAAAGHPLPFNLKYIGIGNEDQQSDTFRERFKLIQEAVKQHYPAINVVGTVGWSPDGTEFTQGWQFGKQQKVEILDEHYYMNPDWFLRNQHRYDQYDRSGPKVYIGEYASRGNTLYNALCEAAYMTSIEKNGDIVQLASYAPLLARKGNTQWNPNLIYFDQTNVYPTINYYVQQLFGNNSGNRYYSHIVTGLNDSSIAASCVTDSLTGDLILKIVNVEDTLHMVHVNLAAFRNLEKNAVVTVLSGRPQTINNGTGVTNILPVVSATQTAKSFDWNLPAYSFTILRWKQKAK